MDKDALVAFLKARSAETKRILDAMIKEHGADPRQIAMARTANQDSRMKAVASLYQHDD
jgi:hypothetical protein